MKKVRVCSKVNASEITAGKISASQITFNLSPEQKRLFKAAHELAKLNLAMIERRKGLKGFWYRLFND